MKTLALIALAYTVSADKPSAVNVSVTVMSGVTLTLEERGGRVYAEVLCVGTGELCDKAPLTLVASGPVEYHDGRLMPWQPPKKRFLAGR